MIFRWLAGLLAVVFLADPIVGVSTWIYVRKGAVRREVRRHILSRPDPTGLVLLGFSKPEAESLLRWEHSLEFEFDGQMYDIVESWTEGDRVYYRCWWDRAETRLNRILREVTARAFGAAPKFGSDERAGPRLLGSQEFFVTQAWKFQKPRPACLRLRSSLERCPSRSIPPPTPPPWAA